MHANYASVSGLAKVCWCCVLKMDICFIDATRKPINDRLAAESGVSEQETAFSCSRSSAKIMYMNCADITLVLGVNPLTGEIIDLAGQVGADLL